MSFFQMRLVFVFYQKGMLLKDRKHNGQMPDFYQNQFEITPDEIKRPIRIPHPVTALYPQSGLSSGFSSDGGGFTSFDNVGMGIRIQVPSTDWTLGEAYINRDGMSGNVERLNLTVLNWSGATDMMKSGWLNNPYTLVAKVIDQLSSEGYLAPLSVPENELITTNTDLQKAGDVVSVAGYDDKGKERTFLKLAQFKTPSGINELIDPPKGYRWAINVIGLVFLVEEKSGKFFAPHEIFNVRDKRGHAWMDMFHVQALSQLYEHQINVLKGLDFTYKAFKSELDDLNGGEQ
jgi:hypothetical protein